MFNCAKLHPKTRRSHRTYLEKVDQIADFADASAFAGASECAAKLLDEAALSEEAKAELYRLTVANPAKKNVSASSH